MPNMEGGPLQLLPDDCSFFSFVGILNNINYAECYKGLQALKGYSTHLNEQESPNQHMSRNQCLLRYGRVNIWVGT
jgi:hypothetical protein